MGDGQRWAAEQDEEQAARDAAEEALRKGTYNGLSTPEDRQRYIEDHKEEYLRWFGELPEPGTMCFALFRSSGKLSSNVISLWEPSVITDSAYCGPWRKEREPWGARVWEVRYAVGPTPSIEIPNLSFVMYVGPFFAIDLSPGKRPMVQVVYNDKTYVMSLGHLESIPQNILDCLKSPPDSPQKVF